MGAVQREMNMTPDAFAMAHHLALIAGFGALSIAFAMLWFVVKKEPIHRGFSIVTGLWALINMAIAAVAGRNIPQQFTWEAREFLAFNLGLNIAYVAAGLTLALTADPDRGFRKGAGWAVLIQGLALLVLDAVLYGRMRALMGA
jgi:cytochrome c biogenesis protein CcdA